MPNLSGMTFGAIVMVTLLIWGYYCLRSDRPKVVAKMNAYEEDERAMVEKHCPQLLREILYEFKTPSGELSSAYTPAIRNALNKIFGHEQVCCATDAILRGEMDFPISEKRTEGGGYLYCLAKFDGPKYVSGSPFIAYGGKSGM